MLRVDWNEVTNILMYVVILCSRQDLTTNLRTDQNSLGTVNQSLLSVPRTPGDVPQVCIVYLFLRISTNVIDVTLRQAHKISSAR